MAVGRTQEAKHSARTDFLRGLIFHGLGFVSENCYTAKISTYTCSFVPRLLTQVAQIESPMALYTSLWNWKTGS